MPERVRSISTVEKPGLRKCRPLSLRVIAGVVLLAFMTVALHGNWVLALVLVGGGLGGWQLSEIVRRRCEREAVLRDVAALTASDFHRYAANLLRAQGYGVLNTAQTDESQGDLLLMYRDENFACRVLHARGRLRKAELKRTL